MTSIEKNAKKIYLFKFSKKVQKFLIDVKFVLIGIKKFLLDKLIKYPFFKLKKILHAKIIDFTNFS